MKIIGICGEAGHGKDFLADWLVKEKGFVRVSLADPLKRLVRRLFGTPEVALWGPSAARGNTYPYDAKAIRQVSGVIIRDAAIELCTDPGKQIQLVKALRAWLDEILATETADGQPVCLSVRTILQTLGTECGRNFDPLLWTNYLLGTAAAKIESGVDYSPKYGFYNVKRHHGMVVPDCRFENEIDAIHDAGGKVVRIRRKSLAEAERPAFASHASEAEQRSIPDERFWRVLEVPEGAAAYRLFEATFR
jgi:hypothetical protein